MSGRPLGAKAYLRRPKNCHRECWDTYLSGNSRKWRQLAKRSIKRIENRAWRAEQDADTHPYGATAPTNQHTQEDK